MKRLNDLAQILSSWLGLGAFASSIAGAFAIDLAFWQYAPPAFRVLALFGAFAVFLVPSAAFLALLQSYEPGCYTPRWLAIYRLPFRRARFDFRNYIGLSGGVTSPVEIGGFQFRLQPRRGAELRSLHGFLRSRATNETFPIRLSVGGGISFITLDEIEILPSGAWFQMYAGFRATHTRETFQTLIGDLDFELHFDGRVFKRTFDLETTMKAVDQYEAAIRSRQPPRPVVRAPPGEITTPP